MNPGFSKMSAPSDAARDAALYRRQIELMLSVSRGVTNTRTTDEALEKLVDIATTACTAERGSLFLIDPQSGDLYTRVTRGGKVREIRMARDQGVVGHVVSSGESALVRDTRADARFNAAVDQSTGFTTRDLLCTPVRAANGEIVGALEVLNRQSGQFDEEDLALLEAISSQAAIALQNTRLVERIEQTRRQERELLDVVSEVSSEIQLGSLLQKIIGEVTRMLDAERSTLFLNDEKTGELWSEIGEGLGAEQIRFPNHLGIAGLVFSSGQTINIPHAYADLRFNPEVDRKTGFFTRSILCVPVVNKDGKRIGVTQVLNKRGGPFTVEDEQRLKAFTAQVSIALENAKLFADVQNMKNYNESMLESMASGVLTVDGDDRIVTCNAAGLRILDADVDSVIGRSARDYFAETNDWVLKRLVRVRETRDINVTMDASLELAADVKSVNLTVVPLISIARESLGSMLMFEDISAEKRVKSTMSRYMDPSLADRLLAGGEDILGGQSIKATVLFSDIRGFTSLTEELGAQGTVALLNEYFTIMVECIQREEGMLDKFIGDAIMAAFGIPLAREDDADRAVRTAVSMMRELGQFNARRAEHGQPEIRIGIGLNTDEVVSGNIGSPKRMDYTIIGDGVNLAARLESACKQYGAEILVSEHTMRSLRGTYRHRRIDRVVVKGKTEPVWIYEILDHLAEDDYPQLAEFLDCYRSGQDEYARGHFEPALRAFERAAQLHPDDTTTSIYVSRCKALISNPPAEWDGVWRLTEK